MDLCVSDEILIEAVDCNNYNLEEIYRFRYDNYDNISIGNGTNEKVICDEYDEKAIHFILKVNNRICGSARIVCSDTSKLELENYYNMDFLITNYKCCEISKLIFDKNFRNGKYSALIYKYIYEFSKQKGIDFGLIFFRVGLEKYYRRIGFTIGNERFIYKNENSVFYGLDHQIGIRQV